MSQEQARALRKQGIDAAKSGHKDQARNLLQRSLQLEPRSKVAWIWMATVAQDKTERLISLRNVLRIDPHDDTARQALAKMGLTPEQVLEHDTQGRRAQPAAQPVEPVQAGVPVMNPQRVEAAQAQIETLLADYTPIPTLDEVEWVRKSEKRAGERDALYLRLAVGAAIATIVLLIGGGATLFVLNSPAAQQVLFAPTWTPSPTFTLTPTSTPGFTPTPSPSPELTLTPSPTVPPSIVQGSIENPPDPTRIYPPVNNRILSDAVVLLNQGRYADALPTLSAQRENTSLSFDASPYYYEALALLAADDTEGALRILGEAESRLAESQSQTDRALVDTGYAQVYLALADEARRDGDAREAGNFIQSVEARAQAAIEDQPELVAAYIALARRHLFNNDFDAALEVLDAGLLVLPADTNLIVQRGEVYFAQGDYARAGQEAFLALYIDPTIEPAYLLQIRSALAQDDPGLAVIYANNYLFFYPGSAEGFKLRGDARVAEGNTGLALIDYDQALAAEEPSTVTAETLVARAGVLAQQRRFEEAREDLTRAYRLTDDPAIQALRMQTAYQSGSYGVALDDAEDLRGSGVLPDAAILLLEARIQIDEAGASDTEAYTEALARLGELDGLPDELIPIADEYRARAYYALADYDAALDTVNAALFGGETGSRRYLRGQILEALDNPEAARREYEWVLAWGEIYPYPFLPDARRRLNGLGDAAES